MIAAASPMHHWKLGVTVTPPRTLQTRHRTSILWRAKEELQVEVAERIGRDGHLVRVLNTKSSSSLL